MPNIRNIIIFIAIGAVMVSIYVFFIRKPAEIAPLVSSSGLDSTTLATGATGIEIGQDFLSLLLNVQTIKLNDAIFSDPAFISLHDSTIVLTPDGNEGRPNPFAPIGVDVAAPIDVSIPSTETSTSTDTGNP